MLETPYPLSDEQISRYRRDGFIALDGIVTGDDLRTPAEAVVAAVDAEKSEPTGTTRTVYSQIFIQKVNLWRRHPAVRDFVLCKRFADVAARSPAARCASGTIRRCSKSRAKEPKRLGIRMLIIGLITIGPIRSQSGSHCKT